MTTSTGKPRGAQCALQGSFYKLGRFDKPFIYVNGGWVATNREQVEIKQRIKSSRRWQFDS